MATNPNSNRPRKRRIKWIVVGCFLVVVTALVCLGTDEERPARLEMSYLGWSNTGPSILISNKIDKPVFLSDVRMQVTNRVDEFTEWMWWGSAQYGIRIAAHQTTNITMNVTNAGVPTKPWRVYAMSTEPVHGIASLRLRVRIYWSQLRGRPIGPSGSQSIFSPTITLYGNETENFTETVVPTNSVNSR